MDHDKVRVENLRRMDAAYKAKKEAKGNILNSITSLVNILYGLLCLY